MKDEVDITLPPANEALQAVWSTLSISRTLGIFNPKRGPKPCTAAPFGYASKAAYATLGQA